MTTKNITEKNSEDRFSFTPEYKGFIDFAKELAENNHQANENSIAEQNEPPI